MKSLVIVMMVSFSGSVWAHGHRHCWVSETRLESSQLGEVHSCEVESPLKLKSESRYYPKIRGGIEVPVEYWEGSLIKRYEIENVYLTTITDRCRIPWKVVSSERHTLRHQETYRLSIENPNLDPEIEETFLLSPLTEKEALEAYEKLERQCRDFQPPPPQD